MTPDQYARRGHKDVHGWLTTRDALAIVKLARAQKIEGGCAEIGVHHGRLFVLLQLLTVGPSVAVDLFDSQEENTDGSGCGSLQSLRENLTRFGELARLRVIARNSLQVTAAEITSSGPVRLFSVDGGHTAECTHNDLRLACEATRDGSLVILDDYFNPHWPAVSEGANQFMAEKPDLYPVYIGANKFIFARGDASPYHGILPGAKSRVFGHPVTIAHDTSLRSRLSRLARRLRGR